MTDHHSKEHRQRMREVADQGHKTLAELEILEMLLLKIQKIRQFGNAAVLAPAAVRSRGLGDASISALKLVEAAGLHLAHSDSDRPVLTIQHQQLAHEPIEYLIMLCLDNRNRLIAETFSPVDQSLCT